jgi:predicted DNA-binding protein (MmcQ/YjbR family)
VSLYKLGGKLFAILEFRSAEYVTLKCDPELVELLREEYEGVVHRTHLDRRFWISVRLDADVPMRELKRLLRGSYELVRAKLTKKQRADRPLKALDII